MHKKKNGFTLVELLIVIAILGIIATLSLLFVTGALTGSRKDVTKIQENNITSAAKAYFNEHLSEFSKETTPNTLGCNAEEIIEENVILRTCTINSEILVNNNYIDQPIDVKTKEDIVYNITFSFNLEKGKVKNLKVDVNL